MNEHIFTHWKLSPEQFACGYTVSRETVTRYHATDIQLVTYPACRAVWQELIDSITATQTKHKRG